MSQINMINLNRLNVLYLDDRADQLNSFKSLFRLNFKIHTSDNQIDAISILESTEIQIIIVDQKMPIISGLKFLQKIKKKYPDKIRILLTGCLNFENQMDVKSLSLIYWIIKKPFTYNQMLLLVRNAGDCYFKNKRNKNKNI